MAALTPSDLDKLRERWPSLTFGENEWVLILTVRGDILDSILDDMHSLNTRKPRRSPVRLTDAQRDRISRSDLPAAQVAAEYDISPRYVDRLRAS